MSKFLSECANIHNETTRTLPADRPNTKTGLDAGFPLASNGIIIDCLLKTSTSTYQTIISSSVASADPLTSEASKDNSTTAKKRISDVQPGNTLSEPRPRGSSKGLLRVSIARGT